MKDSIKLKDLIVKTLDISRVMLDDKVRFMYDPRGAQEVQCHCPFHGKDTKPSARFYRNTNKVYCWKCKKSWNPISYSMDKEGFSFTQAINHLINRYNIDTSSVPDDPEFEMEKVKSIPESRVKIISVKNKIRELRGKVPLERYMALCFVYFTICFKMSKGESIIKELDKLETKI